MAATNEQHIAPTQLLPVRRCGRYEPLCFATCLLANKACSPQGLSRPGCAASGCDCCLLPRLGPQAVAIHAQPRRCEMEYLARCGSGRGVGSRPGVGLVLRFDGHVWGSEVRSCRPIAPRFVQQAVALMAAVEPAQLKPNKRSTVDGKWASCGRRDSSGLPAHSSSRAAASSSAIPGCASPNHLSVGATTRCRRSSCQPSISSSSASQR